MIFYKRLIEIFTSISNENNFTINETFDFFEVTTLFQAPQRVNESDITDLLKINGIDDKLTITITSNGTVFSYSNKIINPTFWENWQRLIDKHSQGEESEIRILIDKVTTDENIVTIYSKDSFFDHLEKLSCIEMFRIFNRKVANSTKRLLFYSTEIEKPFFNKSINFCNSLQFEDDVQDFPNRLSVLEKIKSVSHFTGISNNQLLPSDFYFIQADDENRFLSEKFQTLCMILTIGSLFDIVTIEKDKIQYKLNGYKSISGSIPIENISKESLKEYFEIYNWVLENGSFHDKIGLARNLISLNLSSSGDLKIDDSVFVSIKSGFRAYEKQNVKQYIELRNKISDQLIGFNEKANKIVENFASGFQKSALVFVSLFSTIVVSKVLSSKDFKNVFTPDATILADTFLFISLLYFFVCLWEIFEQEKRLVESYTNMKLRNEDLLTKDDIIRILNDDKEHKADLQFIKSKKKWYALMWIAFILIFLGVVTYLNHLYCVNLTKEVSSIKAV